MNVYNSKQTQPPNALYLLGGCAYLQTVIANQEMQKALCLYFSLIICLFSFAQRVGEDAWVNVNYKNCLLINLPCQCYSFNPPNFIGYNLDNTKFIVLDKGYVISDYSDEDTIKFNLIDRSKYAQGDSSIIEGKVKIKEGLMTINDSIEYQRIETWLGVENDGCLDYLNFILTSNGHRDLYQILNTNTLTCTCDIQFGINKVYDGERVWVFERKNETLNMYTWNYPKDRGLRAKKKLKRKFELNQDI